MGCDGGKDSVEQVDTNNPPVANAGPDLEVTSDDEITIDGSASYDPDGDPIIFHWAFNRVPAESGLQATAFPGNHTATKSTALRADVPGTYIVDLFVEDALGKQSQVDSVVISVVPGDDPIASAGPDLEGIVDKPVSLDGSGSYDPLGRSLSYAWTLASAPANSSLSAIESADQAVTSLTPDVGGRFVVSLSVENGMSTSQPDIAYIDVSSADPEPPVADAGEDITNGQDCAEVALNGSGSFDPNGDILTYEWTLQEKPADSSAANSSITNRNAETTSFTPDISGTYVFSLSVKDNDGWSQPDLVTMQVSERSYNTEPDIEAGSDLALDGGTAVCQEQGYTYDCEPCSPANVTLGTDASASDADGDMVSLLWSVMGDADASILSPTDLRTTAQVSGATPLEPLSCTDTVYTFELAGTDCPGAVGKDQMTVTVTCCGINPPDSGR
jgi:hypothetical protein